MISKRPINERRKDPRVDSNLPLKLFHDQGDIVTETGNISRSGSYCKVSKYIEPMTKLKICLFIPMKKDGKSINKKICCEGVVVRSEPTEKEGEFSIAIFFNNISQRDAETISEYVGPTMEYNPSAN